MIIVYLLLGTLAGFVSGTFGIGGGIILVPLLVAACGMTNHQAQGTTLCVFALPVMLLAASTYYRSGQVNVIAAGTLAIGFLVGSPFGAQLALRLPSANLSKIFGALLLIVGLKMLLR